MSRQIKLLQLTDVSHRETPNEILIDTQLNTELHVITEFDKTIIKFPFGNKFDVIDGCIIIYEKK